MNRNVEIKARVASREAIERRARDLADEGPVTLMQEDTFFVCPRGRLKLRRLGAAEGELIYYERPDSAEPKGSRYAISRTPDPEGLAASPLMMDDGLLEAEDRWFESSIINHQSSIAGASPATSSCTKPTSTCSKPCKTGGFPSMPPPTEYVFLRIDEP